MSRKPRDKVPSFDVTSDPTPGLALIYSPLHEHLPSTVPFAVASVSLGREEDNTLSIPGATVARYHARFERRSDGSTSVVDLQSTDGTFVNGRRVRDQPLSAHDVVRIGNTLFRFVDRGIYGYGAYRIDGTVVGQARPFAHGVESTSLVGGYQIDSIVERLARVAQSTIGVLFCGESGTGKELAARELHRLSGRTGEFIAINCAALPENLIESELFGYRRGAFSGANLDKAGLVRAAHGGTLFLDEVGEMSLDAQAKLLRVLLEKQALPLGATQAEPVDVRVICATHRDLEAHVAQGHFRGDLLARLRGLLVRVPSLRERREDLYPLVLSFLKRQGLGEACVQFPFMLALAHHSWPNNVRELESAVRIAVTSSGGGALDPMHLPEPVRRSLDGHGLPADPGAEPPSAGVTAVGERTSRTEQASPAPKATKGDYAPWEEPLRELLTRYGPTVAAVGRELSKERKRFGGAQSSKGQRVRAQPLIAVRDVEASSRWYQALLGCRSGHGGGSHEMLISGTDLVLQLHAWGEEEHPNLKDPDSAPRGHGVLLWFEVSDFAAAVRAACRLKAEIVEEPHVNPGSGKHEIWLRDPDEYIVVLAGQDDDGLDAIAVQGGAPALLA